MVQNNTLLYEWGDITRILILIDDKIVVTLTLEHSADYKIIELPK